MEEIEKKGIKILKNIFQESDIKILDRLLGGRSNYTFVVAIDEKKYTLRIPGENGNNLLNRIEERDVLIDVDCLNINNETIYFNVDSGVKISKFIEGTPLSELNYHDYSEEIVGLIRKLHESKKFKNDYDPFKRLLKYESLLIESKLEIEEEYLKTKEELGSYKKLYQNIDLRPCHNDTQVSNFILSKGKLFLTDWEFGANNDIYYDLASFSNTDFDFSFRLCRSYFGRPINSLDKKKIYFWRAFQTLQWHNVARYKEAMGLSRSLKIDFLKISEEYLRYTNEILGLLADEVRR